MTGLRSIATFILMICALAEGTGAQVMYQGKPLDYWVDQVQAGQWYGGVYQAFEELGCSAAPAVPRLMEMLKDPKLAGNAGSALGYIGDAAALPVFIAGLASADRYKRLASCGVIGSIVAAERGAVWFGHKRTRCSDPSVKLTQTIGPTMPPLINLLADDDNNVANCAHSVLVGMGSFSVASLAGVARDSARTTGIRAGAARALGMIGPAAIDALPVLRKLVATPTEDALIRGEANAAVLKIEGRSP